MISCFSDLSPFISLLLYLFTIIVFVYFIYSRILKPLQIIKYYNKQGVPLVKYCVPFFGNVPRAVLYLVTRRHHLVSAQLIPAKIDNPSNPPKISMLCVGNTVSLMVSDPQLIEKACTKLANSIDKSSHLKIFGKQLLGNSFAVQNSNENSNLQRKIIVKKEFYRHLNQNLNIVKEKTHELINEWRSSLKYKKPIDVEDDILKIMSDIMTKVLIGVDSKNETFQVSNYGFGYQTHFGYFRHIFKEYTTTYPAKALFFPELGFAHLLPHEINQVGTINNFRKQIKKIIQISLNSGSDSFVKCMLNEPLYNMNIELVIDDLLAIMLGGVGSLGIALQNELWYLSQNDDVLAKLRESLGERFNFENSTYEKDLKENQYLDYCFMEALRMDPPGKMAVEREAIENIQLGGVDILKGQKIYLLLDAPMKDDRFWQCPFKYNPERFDKTQQMSQCPFASKRPHTTFIPFMHGQRSCLGETFSMHAHKIIISGIVSSFDIKSEIRPEIKPMNDFQFANRLGLYIDNKQ